MHDGAVPGAILLDGQHFEELQIILNDGSMDERRQVRIVAKTGFIFFCFW